MTGYVPNWSASAVGQNVKAFGAVGDGVADDTAAIQAAVDSSVANTWSASQRGVVLFPPGKYLVTAPISLALSSSAPYYPSIALVGCAYASSIVGNFAGFLVSRDFQAGVATGGISIEKLHFENAHAAGGCLQISGAISHSVRDCSFDGFRGLVLFSSGQSALAVGDQGSSVDACHFGNNSKANAIGCVTAANSTITNCDFTGLRFGVMAFGLAANIIACRFERNGFPEGFGPNLTGALSGAGIASSAALGASLAAANPFSNSTFSWGMGDMVIMGNTFESNYTAIDILYGTSGLTVLSNSFQQSEVGGAYGIRTRANLDAALFANFTVGVDVTGAAIEVTTKHAGGDRCQLVFMNVSATNPASVNPGGVAWDVTAASANSAQFIQCNIQPVWTFSQLPPAGKMYEGDRFSISDGQKSGGGTAVFADIVAGGGSQHIEVRWNGSNWTRCG